MLFQAQAVKYSDNPAYASQGGFYDDCGAPAVSGRADDIEAFIRDRVLPERLPGRDYSICLMVDTLGQNSGWYPVAFLSSDASTAELSGWERYSGYVKNPPPAWNKKF